LGISLGATMAGASIFSVFFIVGAAPLLALAEYSAKALVP